MVGSGCFDFGFLIANSFGSFLFFPFLSFGRFICCKCFLEHRSCFFSHKFCQLQALNVFGFGKNLTDCLYAFVRDWIMSHIVLAQSLILSHRELHSIKNFLTIIELTVRQTDICQSLCGCQALEYQDCPFVHQRVTLQVQFENLRVLEDQDLEQSLGTVWPDVTV